ncbi:MAG: ABC transporter ATP-binding protein [candidate division Zixibacteria bacterium]|nr:ABC transporter ATP-binding protein [candidate division Zixibacteria bacterium]
MDKNEFILSATNIHRQFKTANSVLPVLKGLSLGIQRGKTAAVTGASGVGKSTLLHIMGGLDRPTEGAVTVAGVILGNKTETQLAAFRNETIGFVFQFHYLMNDFTALENVMIPLLVAGKKKGEAADEAEHLLEIVGLRDRTSHRPKQLSGGEQQRVAVARALANDPPIVLADEPSGNLDTSTGRRLHDLLFQLNADNDTTFLIATHNRELAERCDSETQIVDGKVFDHITRR